MDKPEELMMAEFQVMFFSCQSKSKTTKMGMRIKI